MNHTPTLTTYQFEALRQTARRKTPIFLVPCPRRTDKPSVRFCLLRRSGEIKQLVTLKLMEDISEQFSEVLHANAQKETGRAYTVYGLTEAGHALFKDCESRLIN